MSSAEGLSEHLYQVHGIPTEGILAVGAIALQRGVPLMGVLARFHGRLHSAAEAASLQVSDPQGVREQKGDSDG